MQQRSFFLVILAGILCLSLSLFVTAKKPSDPGTDPGWSPNGFAAFQTEGVLVGGGEVEVGAGRVQSDVRTNTIPLHFGDVFPEEVLGDQIGYLVMFKEKADGVELRYTFRTLLSGSYSLHAFGTMDGKFFSRVSFDSVDLLISVPGVGFELLETVNEPFEVTVTKYYGRDV
jgi:hypothetical protein